jgi:hypothetical protein
MVPIKLSPHWAVKTTGVLCVSSTAFRLVAFQLTAALGLWKKIYYILPSKYLQKAIPLSLIAPVTKQHSFEYQKPTKTWECTIQPYSAHKIQLGIRLLGQTRRHTKTYLVMACDKLWAVIDVRILSRVAIGLVEIQPMAKLRLWRKIYYILPLKYLQQAIPVLPLGTGNIASSTRSRQQVTGLWLKLLMFSHILLIKSRLALGC